MAHLIKSRQYPALSSVLPDKKSVYVDIPMYTTTGETYCEKKVERVRCRFVALFQAKTNGFVIDKPCLEFIYEQMTRYGATPTERTIYEPIYCPNAETLIRVFVNIPTRMKGMTTDITGVTRAIIENAMRRCYVYLANKQVYLADLYAHDDHDEKTEIRHELEEKIRRELEEKIRRELEEKIRHELEEKIRRELEEKIRRELEEKIRRELSTCLTIRRPRLATPLPVTKE